jgi:predicted Zn-dependent protease with MMP-like domain
MSDIKSHHPVIELAWRRQTELSKNSTSKRDEYYSLRKWITYLGVAAVLFAILYDTFHEVVPGWASWILRIFLIATPIVSSAIAAFGKQFQQGKQYLALRGAAEEIKKEIFLYRTILKNEPNRYKILNDRLAKIQRTMFQSINGELVLKPYNGPIPPYYDPNDPNSDPGITDLSGDEYFTFRVKDQLDWHTRRINERHAQRRNIQIWILIFGGLGAFLAAIGDGFAVWVALTAAITSAFVGWEEIRGLDETIANYSRVVLELNIICDRWLTLHNHEKTDEEFFKMARETDQEMQEKIAEQAYDVIATAHNQTYERVALGVEDAAADVKEHMALISEEVTDGFEVEAALADQFEDAVLPETAVSEGGTFVDEVFQNEATPTEFQDEVFDDGEPDVFDADWDNDEDDFFSETAVKEDFVDEVFVDEEPDDSGGVG